MDFGAVAVQLTLGLNDTEPTDWSGSFQLPARRVVAIEGAEAAGDTGWKAESAPIRTRAARKKDATSMLRPVRLTATLAVGANSSVEVTTNQGAFAFRPMDVTEWGTTAPETRRVSGQSYYNFSGDPFYTSRAAEALEYAAAVYEANRR